MGSLPKASAADARAALAAAQMDENGLDPVHHRILDILRKRGRPLALRRLAAQAGITAEAFRSIYEPALVACGAVVPTPRGMMAAR